MQPYGIVMVTSALAATAALGASASGARPRATPIFLASGSYVVFKGTTVQCLTFGPIARVKGKIGIFCFIGPPRKHKADTYWGAITPSTGQYSTSGTDPIFRAITSGTRISSTITTTGGSLLRVSGTKIGCVFERSHTIDPGHKAVFCTDVDERGPLPKSAGLALPTATWRRSLSTQIASCT